MDLGAPRVGADPVEEAGLARAHRGREEFPGKRGRYRFHILILIFLTFYEHSLFPDFLGWKRESEKENIDKRMMHPVQIPAQGVPE